jgi:hypothetical protein
MKYCCSFGALKVKVSAHFTDFVYGITSKNRVISAILAENPDIDSIELLVKTFRCIYYDDFSPDEMARICQRIRQYHQKKKI